MVFVLDALIYTLTHWPKSATATIQTDQSCSNTAATSSHRQPTNQSGDPSLQMECTPTKSSSDTAATAVATTPTTNDDRFFKRSESILGHSSTSESEGDPETKKSNQKFFGPSTALIESPDLVGSANFPEGRQGRSKFAWPLSESYPLAQQPYLLKPYARKEQLFSSPARMQGEGAGVGEGGGGGGGGEGEGEGGRGKKRGATLPVSYRDDVERYIYMYICTVLV